MRISIRELDSSGAGREVKRNRCVLIWFSHLEAYHGPRSLMLDK